MNVKRNLSAFDNRSFDRGKPVAMEALWKIVSALVFRNPLVPFYALKRGLLRCFGATIGERVLIKPNVTITFPWKLSIGDGTWIGEGAWIDNLDRVEIGANVCVSQGAYLCTGNHDYKKESFDLIARPIVIEDGAWVSAKAVVAPGAVLRRGCVIGLGSVAKGELEAFCVYEGVPAVKKNR